MPIRHYLCPLFVLLALVCPSTAATPEQVVSEYFERIKTGGLKAIAPLVHPDELHKFREMTAPIVAAALESGERHMFKAFADPKEPTKLRELSDEEFMGAFLDAIVTAQPRLATALKNVTIQVIGHVPEGEVKHVVVRARIKNEGVEAEKLSVLSVRDFEGEPRLLLTGEVKGLAEAIKRMR